MSLVELVYSETKLFPAEEKFHLTNQIRRSATSIPSNIAEGQGRKSRKEFSRFLRIAYGSSSELETQIILAHRLNLLSETAFTTLNSELVVIRKMLNKLMTVVSEND